MATLPSRDKRPYNGIYRSPKSSKTFSLPKSGTNTTYDEHNNWQITISKLYTDQEKGEENQTDKADDRSIVLRRKLHIANSLY